MKHASNSITFMQFVFIIHGCQIGTGVFALPKNLAEKAGTDGWISLILVWCLNVIASMIILLVYKKYPDDTLPDLMIRLFGRMMGKILIIPIICYFAFFFWIILTSTMLFIKQWFLPLTPDYIVMALVVVPGYLVASKGMRILGRFSELVFYMTIWLFVILFIPLKHSHWIHLLPVIKDGWLPIFQGIEGAIYPFLGSEILFFIYPFLQKKHLAVRGVVLANTITLLINLQVTLICFAFFSPDGIKEYTSPLFNLLKVIEFKFIERFDMIFFAFYIFVVMTSWLPYAFGAILSTEAWFGTKNPAPIAAIFLTLAIVFTLFIHPSWNQSAVWMRFISKMGVGFVYIFPIFLYLYIRLYNRFRRSES